MAQNLGEWSVAPFDGAHMTVGVERTFAAPLARVWAIAGDTDTLNRNAGMAPVELEPTRREGGLFLRARVRMLGLAATYEAPVPTIRAPHGYAFERRFDGGPMEAYRLTWRFEERGAETWARVQIEARLRAVARVALPLTRMAAERELTALLDAIDVGLEGATAPIAIVPSGAADERIGKAMTVLRRHHEAVLCDALEALLLEGDDLECASLRPRLLARRWGVDEGPLVALLFAAVDAGLVRLRWSLLCPSCRAAAVESDDLGRVGSGENHCEVCAIGFGADLERNVEAVFVPDPAIRPVEVVRWCTGGPAKMPHVRLQDGDVTARAPLRWLVPREPGAYQIFAMGGLRWPLVVEEGGDPDATITLGPLAASAPLALAPGASLTVHVPSDFRGFVRLEEQTWRVDALTARELFLMNEARGRVVPGSLRTSAQLSLGRVAVLFTDLTGSTALYEAVGDAQACAVVLDHFEVIRGVVEASSGTVLKTIGDAVLALYTDEAAAVLAAAAIDRAVRRHLAQRGLASKLGLKIAVYGGPGFLVREGDRLDVYGRIVNRAARLEGEAETGEILMPSDAFAALPARVKSELEVGRRFTFQAKGVSVPLEAVACRVRV
jgi:adenylate cyclase